MTVIQWFTVNWFDLVQTLGIIGSCLFTGIAIRAEKTSQRVSNLFLITKQNREIWSEIYERPELARLLDKSVDLAKSPMTTNEELFVNQLVLHLAATWRAIQEGEFMHLEGLEEDIRSFFSLPIPHTAWEKVKRFQDKAFAALVEKSTRLP